MTIRARIEQTEHLLLALEATFADRSAGRDRPETPCDLRTDFQRDRDRILHCKSFRRLKHKTQVFLSPEGDHYRTRLTHTLEVAQIARTVARCLRLNEDLTEAIALGHDLGHTPFGHAGERALNECMASIGGFAHYEQSVRVVERLENDGTGLNLTVEVRDGILHHTIDPQASTPEGRIVRIADRIAYINHDIDDAERAGILQPGAIPDRLVRVLGDRRKTRIDTMVRSLVTHSTPAQLAMAADVQEAFDALHEFLYANVYRNPAAKSEEAKVPELVGRLFAHYCAHPETLPDDLQPICAAEGIPRAVGDYIAGMTDGYAIRAFESLMIPQGWQGR